MKRITLLVISVFILLALTACRSPEITGYHIDENGKLIATYEDNTTADLGSLSDTISNGANTIIVNDDGFYVINGVVSKIKANLPESYEIDGSGNLIVTYTDTTTKNLGKFGDDAINTIDTIAISYDGFYVINGIKTDIAAVDVFDVKFVTGYDATIKTQTVKDGDKVTRPQLEREGYTLKGWYCNGEEWRFNSDVVLNEMTLAAEWQPNQYTISFSNSMGTSPSDMVVTFDESTTLPTLEEETGYTFVGWYYNNAKVVDGDWKIAEDIVLTAKWERDTYQITFDSDGGSRINSITVDSYSTINDLPIPTRDDYEFLGWYYNDELIQTPYDFTEGNMQLTASWKGINEKFEFSDIGDEIKIDKYLLDEEEVIIPLTIGGKTVTTIASNAFKDKTNLKSIKFSNAINFEYQAISGCDYLESIELLGEANTTLVYMFGGESNIPSSLRDIVFSEDSSTFGDWIFDEISSNTRTFSVYVNAQITKAPEDAFYECNSIDKLYFSDTIVTFDLRVICALPNLTYVDLPDNLKSVGMNNFINCPKLLYVIYPISLTSSGYAGLCASESVILVEATSRPSGWGSSAFSIYEEDLNIFYGFEKLVETDDFLYALCKVGSTTRCVIIQRYNSSVEYPEFIEGYPVTFTNNNYTSEKK